MRWMSHRVYVYKSYTRWYNVTVTGRIEARHREILRLCCHRIRCIICFTRSGIPPGERNFRSHLRSRLWTCWTQWTPCNEPKLIQCWPSVDWSIVGSTSRQTGLWWVLWFDCTICPSCCHWNGIDSENPKVLGVGLFVCHEHEKIPPTCLQGVYVTVLFFMFFILRRQ